MQWPHSRPWANWQVKSTPQHGPSYNIVPHTEWRYNMRHTSQLIIPGLYLGPLQTALNSEKMQELGITHILCVRDKREKAVVYERYPETYQYYVVEVSEHLNQEIVALIPDCMKYIDHAICNGGTVLAHCLSGMNLAPAFVIAYIMTKYHWRFDQTLSYVQGKRYCVSPIIFERQLKDYEPIYKAIQMYGQDTMGNMRSKRELEDDGDDDDRNPGRKATERFIGTDVEGRSAAV